MGKIPVTGATRQQGLTNFPSILKTRRSQVSLCIKRPRIRGVEVPDSLKSMIEGLRKMEEEGEDEIDLARPRSGGREPKEEFPRPLSQGRPMSAASTGFSHLDEFERKLAEMESELDHDV